MGIHEPPVVGTWYKSTEYQAVFEVVATDEKTNSVEIQFYDGGVDEIDIDSWEELRVSEVADPDDWTAAFELSSEDLHEFDDYSVTHPDDWDGLVFHIETEEDDFF